MGKRNGLSIGLSGNSVVMAITQSDRATDKIWDAVEAAIDSGMTVDEFRREAAQAWADKMRQDAEAANAEWNKRHSGRLTPVGEQK